MDVSIIIVNYNTKQLLADCLVSIYRETSGVMYEVIVVDNASSDGSEEFIRSRFPNIIWINSGKNLGFGQANNLGAKYAQGKYLFFLNSDTVLQNNAVQIFYKYMKENADCDSLGALGSWLLDRTGNRNLSYGNFPSPQEEIRYLWSKMRKRKAEEPLLLNVDFITGADLFLLHDTFEQLKGFDPNFFMYYEETDLQYRMAKMGLRRRIISGPNIVHLEGGSFQRNGLSYSRFVMSQKSYNYYIRKHFHGVRYFLYRIFLIVLRLSVFVTTNWSWQEKIKAYRLVLKGSLLLM